MKFLMTTGGQELEFASWLKDLNCVMQVCTEKESLEL